MEVATLVREAGVEIGMNPEEPMLEEIIARLKQEFIVHDWQVAKLNSSQWQALGAPMGLAVAIQANLEEEQQQMMMPYNKSNKHYWNNNKNMKMNNNEPQPRYSSGLTTSRGSQAIQDSDQLSSSTRSTSKGKKKKSIISKPKSSLFNRHGTLEVMEGKNPIEGDALDNSDNKCDGGNSEILRPETATTDSSSSQQQDNNNNNNKENHPQEQSKSAGEPQNNNNNGATTTCSMHKGCCGKEVNTCFRQMLKNELKVENTSSFCMSKLFDQALLHSKTGADLKAHTMFVIELSVVAAALFLGAAIELWGAFPLDAVSETAHIDGGIPQALAFAFNVTSSLLIISQLLCASAWIWSLRVISAVVPTKFHQYVVETRHFADYINGMSMFGFTLFALDLFLLLAGMSLATTDNWVVNGVALGIALLVFMAGVVMVQKITSFQGRVTYHGMLMTTQNPDPSATTLASKPEESHFKQREDMLHRAFERHSILNESRALDAYSQTCNPDFCALFD